MSDTRGLAELLSLQDRVALVTGGGGGIGAAVAARFLEAGARVFSVDLPGRPCVDGAEPMVCDVSDSSATAELFEQMSARSDRLDLLVHCAGIAQDSVLWKMDDQAWSRVLQVNLDSAFYLMKRAVPLMRRGETGSIVLVSSINGERGKFGQANYAASKAGLIGLGRTVAREAGRFGIRVNIIAPGWIDTAMTESLDDEFRRQAIEASALGCIGQPDDVARAALFLSTPLSRHVTGQLLRVDGGQLMA